MEKLKKHLRNKYNLTNYQIAQIFFLFKTLLSELSKMLIMGLLFHKHFFVYCFALFIMIFLRTTTGGLHFYTYWGCLLMSVAYMGLSIVILPMISVPLPVKLCLLICAIIICHVVGPITSKYRPVNPPAQIQFLRKICIFTIFIFSIALYIIPENAYMTAGFWVIILHSLQLIAGKIKKKGDTKK